MLVGSIALGACGDDDDDTAATGSGSGSGSEVAGGDIDAFCTDAMTIQSSEADIPEDASEEQAAQHEEEHFQEEVIPLARRIRDNAPENIKPDVERIVELFEEKGAASFEDEEVGQLAGKINLATIDACDAEKIEVTAVDYSFQGVPSTVEAGRVGFAFSNEGKELHEFLLLRKNDDTTESFEQLLELPEEQAQAKVSEMGAAFAFPGGSDARLVDLEAGEYMAICFIPVGLTPEAAQSDQEPQGPPHFTQGMRAEFTVE